MKNWWWALVLLCFTWQVSAQENKEIQWKTVEEVEALMAQEPKQVLVSVYTTWCSYCKKMDRTIYKNPQVIAYINTHFYAIKLNAEQAKSIQFQGKEHGLMQGNSRRPVNALAYKWLQGQMSYPSTVFMDPGFKYPTVQPGYLNIIEMESILKYRGSKAYQKQSFDAFVVQEELSWK